MVEGGVLCHHSIVCRLLSMVQPDDSDRFDRVDWDELDHSRRVLTLERRVFLTGSGALALAVLYTRTVSDTLPGGWTPTTLDWIVLLGLVVLAALVGVPAYRHRDRTKRALADLTARRSHRLATALLVLVGLAGLLGSLLISLETSNLAYRYQPPPGFSVDEALTHYCAGATTEADRLAETGECHGSTTYLLGTNERGHAITHLLIEGARVSLYVVVFTAAFVVPLATVIGLVAGLRGGLVDDLLMSWVDIQLCLPALLLYFIGYFYWGPSLLLLLVTFGLLSWGPIARLVRSEVLQRREAGHVLVARSLGARESYVAKRHILPNITNTVVPATFHLLAMLVLVEAGVAFLGFHELTLYSWGATISESVNAATESPMQTRASYPAYQIWWISTFPAIALTVTIASLKLVGDGLRDALDPRGER